MESAEPRQYWVRNDKGTMWGPLSYATIELLVANGMIAGRLQVSRDGLTFAFPGRFPDIREAFPKDLWGDSTEPLPGDTLGTTAPTIGGPRVQTVGAPQAAAPQPAPAAAEPAAQLGGPLPDTLPPEGDLAKLSPFQVFYLVAAANLTGLLTLKGPAARYGLFLKKGSPEAISTTSPEQDIGAFLVKTGALKQEQLTDARAMLAGFGGDLVNALFGMRLLNPADAFRIIGEHSAELLPKALALESGTYDFNPAAPMPAVAMPLGDRWALVCDAVRALTPEDMKKRLGPALDAPIMRSGGRVDVQQLKLTPQEARVSAYFDGVRSLNQLVAALPNEAEVILRTAFMLAQFEGVAFAAVRVPAQPKPEPVATPTPPPEATPTPPPAAPPRSTRPSAPAGAPPRLGSAPTVAPAGGPPTVAPPAVAAAGAARPTPAPGGPPRVAPAAPPGGPPKLGQAAPQKAPAAAPGSSPAILATDPGMDPAKLKAYLDALKTRTYFQMLGLPENAPAAQVKPAFFKLAKQFHPDTFTGAPPDVAKLKSDIFQLLTEASRVLGDEALRAEYVTSQQAKAVQDRISGQSPGEAFQKGQILIRARKFAEALSMLEEAAKADDKNVEFASWVAFARFLTNPDHAVGRAAAQKELEAATRLDPKSAVPFYVGGLVLKLAGEPATAEKWFRKAASLDPNHADTQRELKALAAAPKK